MPSYDALRVAYRRGLMRIAALDLTAPDPIASMPAVGEALAELAAARGGPRDRPGGARARPRAVPARDHRHGQDRGGELNYVSDVDVIFVAEPADGVDEDTALRIGTALATATMRACSTPTSRKARCGPSTPRCGRGQERPLVRTIRSHKAYYERWAKTWEFRPC